MLGATIKIFIWYLTEKRVSFQNESQSVNAAYGNKTCSVQEEYVTHKLRGK